MRTSMERVDLEQWKAREVARLLALVETERRYYQEIIAALPVGLIVLSSDLAIISSNRSVKRIFGLRSGESLRGRLDSLFPTWLLDRVGQVLETGVSQTNIAVDSDMNGGRQLRVSIQLIHNWDEEAELEALLTIEDVTDLAHAEVVSTHAALASPASEPVATAAPEAELHYEPESHPLPLVAEPAPSQVSAKPAHTPELQAADDSLPASVLLENLHAGVWAVDAQSNEFVFANPEAHHLLGDHPWEQVHPDDVERVKAVYRAPADNPQSAPPRITCEYRVITPDHQALRVRDCAQVFTTDDHVAFIIGVSGDVTERVQCEQQALQSARIDAVTRLSGRLAHDLNNILMIVTGYAEELLHGLPAHSPMQADVQEILTATGRIAGLANQLLGFTRIKAAPGASLALNDELRRMEDSLKGLLGPIQMEWNLAAEPIGAHANAGQLQQVMEAFARRAREACVDAGTLTIATSRKDLTENLGAHVTPGAFASIQMSDDCSPLTSEARSVLFENILAPREGNGDSGPALATAYGYVRQWGGDIIAGNAKDSHGSSIEILLPWEQIEAPENTPEPAPEHSASPEPPAAPATPAAAVPETVLLVEDESGIRALVRKILMRQGYQVIEAESAEQALEIAAHHKGDFDLIVTDMILPHLGGRELVKRLQSEGRNMKVLYVSGYTDDPGVYAEELPPGSAFLQKPFTLGSLLDKVKQVLSEKSA